MPKISINATLMRGSDYNILGFVATQQPTAPSGQRQNQVLMVF
jgi:hypothetical protein